MKKIILTFHTHAEALKAFRLVKEVLPQSNAKLVAVPRRLSSSCGTALQLQVENFCLLTSFDFAKAFECEGEEFLPIAF